MPIFCHIQSGPTTTRKYVQDPGPHGLGQSRRAWPPPIAWDRPHSPPGAAAGAVHNPARRQEKNVGGSLRCLLALA